MSDEEGGDPTEGSLLRNLVFLSAPLLVQNVVRVAQQLADVFWLGRLSGEAVAAVGLVAPVTALLFSIVILGPFVGTQVLVSQRVGSDDEAAARRATFTGLTLVSILGVAFAAITFVGAEPLVRSISNVRPQDVSTNVLGMASTYLAVYALGLPVFATSDIFEAGFIGWGDSRASMYVNVVTVGINVVLDPFLIFGYGPVPALGIRGAALASVLGACGGLGLGLALVVSERKSDLLSWNAVSFDLDEYREMLDVGLPRTGQSVAQQTVRLAMVVVVFAAGGTAGLVAYTLGSRLTSITSIPARGIRQASQTIVGQNLGADKPERAIQMTLISATLAVVVFTAFGVVQWLKPGFIARLIVPGLDGDAFALSVEYLRILVYGYPALGAFYMFQAGFDGAKHTQVSFVASIFQSWVVRLPIAVVGSSVLGYGVVAAFWAVSISRIAAAIGLGGYYRVKAKAGAFHRPIEEVSSEEST